MARNVQSLEVVVIVFDFRPLLHGIACPGKEMLDSLQGAGYRMQTTEFLASAGQSHVNGFTGEFLLDGGTLEITAPRVDGLFNLAFGFIDLLAGSWTFLGGKLTKGFRLLGNHALFAKILNTNLIKCLQAVSAIDRRQTVLNQLLQVFH